MCIFRTILSAINVLFGVKMNEIRTIRRRKGLTQAQVAQQAGISRAFYTRVENGVCAPSVAVARRLALALGIEWTRFFEAAEASLRGRRSP